MATGPLDPTVDLAIDRAVDRAVGKTFAILGVDVDDPQQVEAFRENLRFAAKMRRISDHGAFVIVGAIASGVVLTFWFGIKALVGK